MRKVVCFAILALSALAADTGARHELSPRLGLPSGGGFAVVWTSPGQLAEQVEELARMLGGLEVTEATRQHAREMLATRR